MIVIINLSNTLKIYFFKEKSFLYNLIIVYHSERNLNLFLFDSSCHPNVHICCNHLSRNTSEQLLSYPFKILKLFQFFNYFNFKNEVSKFNFVKMFFDEKIFLKCIASAHYEIKREIPLSYQLTV